MTDSLRNSRIVTSASGPATGISSATGLTSLSLFSVRNFQSEQSDAVFIEELRIANSFADALGGEPIPELSQL